MPEAGGQVWQFGGIEFVDSFERRSTPERFCIRKGQSLIDLYQGLLPRFHGARIVELGIAAGGGTALIALVAEPEKLVACELDPEAIDALAELLHARGLEESVRPYYGVDQSDRARLREIVDAEFGGAPIDLVIDDASHLYAETLASFEVLYPRLRPGGLFVIEDWAAQYQYARNLRKVIDDPGSDSHAALKRRLGDAMLAQARPKPPLARLCAELMLAASDSPDVVAGITVDSHWVTVERGPAPLDPDRFRIGDISTDYFGWFPR